MSYPELKQGMKKTVPFVSPHPSAKPVTPQENKISHHELLASKGYRKNKYHKSSHIILPSKISKMVEYHEGILLAVDSLETYRYFIDLMLIIVGRQSFNEYSCQR